MLRQTVLALVGAVYNHEVSEVFCVLPRVLHVPLQSVHWIIPPSSR